ncbi:hypothetical protein H2201_003252 [Coniosporium apollinis]|uniref:Carboxypeptidase n=1 Tax=Coniosporium apollinis TaxID=61459 RepID=A0ABQ9P154_9PEZI|nr:hypothetical protein H2201_003252 [Coniosporium apollinis]
MWSLLLLLVTSLLVEAQYPPPISNSTVIQSPINPNITISYKSPDPGTCKTVFDTQKQYTGYISLPPLTLVPIQQNYSINTFFWFIEARQQPEIAPLTIWLNGGPGSSSLIGLFQENGPCEVVQLPDGSYGTQARTWGWDRSSNIIFVDQPAQVGLSYDTLENVTYNLLSDRFVPQGGFIPSDLPPYALLNGTFASFEPDATANTTQIAAHAIWHFLQGFLAAFPQYNPGTRPNSTTTLPTGINLFAESYGGMYGPVFADLFEQKNAQRLSGVLPRNSTLEIRLTSLGIINGLIDTLVQAPSFPQFAYNNTYGIQAISQTQMLNSLSEFNAPGRCRELILSCRRQFNSLDPEGEGDVETVNAACFKATNECNRLQFQYYISAGRDVYDIRQMSPSPFPPLGFLEYLNSANVQQAIGARVNFTQSSNVVFNEFTQTGDITTGAQLRALTRLLALNIRISLIYGDSDYICNWVGGEAVSLALATHPSLTNTFYPTAFPAAGYAPLIINSSYIGGAVRQFGNLSFVRVYDAGHLVPAYQPETAFTVFARVLLGTDIATGEAVDLDTFATEGPLFSTHTNAKDEPPHDPSPTCWVRAIPATCTDEQQRGIEAGEGVVRAGVWYADERGVSSASSSAARASAVRSSSTSSVQVTGVYVATATPSQTGGVGRVRGGGVGLAGVVGAIVAGWWVCRG